MNENKKTQSKALLMDMIAEKAGVRYKKYKGSIIDFTRDDCRRILDYIEELEYQNYDLKKKVRQ